LKRKETQDGCEIDLEKNSGKKSTKKKENHGPKKKKGLAASVGGPV